MSIVPFKGDVAVLSSALRAIQTDVGDQSAILKMDRTGHWVFGADQTEVEEGSRWAVNPFSFIHGYIAWGEGEVLGEKIAPITQPLPEIDDAPLGAKRGWEKLVGMSLACISGEDKGLNVRYTVTSVGGKKAVQALATTIAEQVETDPTKPVPVITLGKDHYQHKAYGRIFTPVFDVVEWASMDGEPAEEEPKQRKRRA
jgi:hypothetical protein